jgi:glutamate carboxypeptidase
MDSQGILERLRRLVAIESPSGDRPGLEAMAAEMAEWLVGAGLAVSIEDTDAGPLVRGRRAGPAPHILILGHLDTVWSRGTLQASPCRVEEGRAYGPGIYDMKGGLALTGAALESLRHEALPSAVEVLLTPDEEVGSHASRSAIEGAAVGARLVLVLEAPAAAGALKVGRKGVGSFRLDIQGRAAHAGLEPERGVDAVEELAHQILRVRGLARPDRGTTVNLGLVGGGTRSNVVAEQAWAEIDVRVAEAAERDRMAASLGGLVPVHPAARVSLTGGWNRPAMEPTEAVWAWVARARELWRGYGRGDLGAAFVGGASDGNFTAPLAPTVDGLGPLGDGAHARHEHVLVEPLADRARLIADLLREAELGLH